MRSVADALREDDRARLAAMSPAERVVLALALGARDLESFRAAQDPPLAPDDAARALARHRQAGRRRSSCAEELIG